MFCSVGITNYEEYSLIQEVVEEKKEDGMGTLKKDRTLLRDERKMEKLKAKLHTDDDRELTISLGGGDVPPSLYSRCLEKLLLFPPQKWQSFISCTKRTFPVCCD